MPSETGAQIIVPDMRLADGTALRLVARNALFTGMLDGVCLERRLFVETSTPRYHAAPANRCPAP